MGNLLIFLAGWYAEMEGHRKSERVRASHRRVKAEGGRWGRRPIPYDVARMRELKAKGNGYRKIARLMNVSVGTVFQRLNPGRVT